jgi:hypothetical protein
MTENFDNPALEPDLALLAGEIHKLALDDLPPPGLEERIFAATMPVLRQAAAPSAAPTLVLTGTLATHRRRLWLTAPMRMAASVALLATVGAVWLGNRHAVAPAAPRAQPDDWAIVTNLFDDTTVNAIQQLTSDTAVLDAKVHSVTMGDLMLEEGAM